jgi:hypothetical protein
MRCVSSFLRAVAVVIFAAGCGYRELPPPPAPALRFPDVKLPSSPAPEGKVRVVLDANGSSAVVTEVSSWRSSAGSWSGETTGKLAELSTEERPVCIAPCVADLAPGMHVLRFKSMTDERASTIAVQINHQSKVIRHAMGRSNDDSAKIGTTGAVLAAAGLTSMLVGALVLGAAEEEDQKETGVPLMISGAGAILISVPLFFIGRPERQLGATTEFEF